MTNKLTTYWLVRGGPEGPIPIWEQLEGPPDTEGLHGELRVENDEEVMMIFFVDAAAEEIVTRASRDGVALAQEFMIPRRPAEQPDDA
jgi:hypothetical protein